MPRTLPWIAVLALAGLAVAPADLAQTQEDLVSEEVRELTERLVQERFANRVPLQLFAPLVRSSSKATTEVYLLNLTTLPVPVSLHYYDRSRNRSSVGSLQLEPRTHQTLDLTPYIEPAPGLGGYIGVSFEGDNDTLQCWTVHRSGAEAFETPCTNPAKLQSNRSVGFWGIPATETRTSPHLALFNVGASRLPYRARLLNQGFSVDHQGSIEPGQIAYIEVPLKLRRAGAVEIDHEGTPADLIVSGIWQGNKAGGAIPILEAGNIPAVADYHGFALGQLSAAPAVTAFNQGAEAASVEIRAIDASTGQVLRQRTMRLEGREVRTWPMTELFKGLALTGVRLQIVSPGQVLANANALGAEGQSIELALFPAESAHGGGTYPLPALSSADVKFSAVNLSDEEITILGQAFWEGGSYALEPIVIPARVARTVDFRTLAAEARPDLLGRTLDPGYRRGYFKWLARGRQDSLIGRTEVFIPGSTDRFGFNCFGCCWQYPSGSLLPTTVSFLPGQTVGFQACVTFNTCGGNLGPYPTFVNYVVSPAPFSWDGSNVTASAAASDTLQFQGTEDEVGAQCVQRERTIAGAGKADTCDHHLNNGQVWRLDTPCSQQVSGYNRCLGCEVCCLSIKNHGECRLVNQTLVNSQYNSCQTLCQVDLGCP